ncbi:MAG: hypothetical protein KC543_14555, partial [Myxococcales bacterium]|nr:hypothetical protein [Myxococcales bacterium]
GGGAPAAGEAATTGAEQPATKRASAIALLGLTPPEQPWAQMGFKDREMYMIGKVLPIAEEIFEQHDPKRFANFQCEDCHGEDMKARNYAMPSPTMFAVPEPGTDAYARMTKAYPDMVPFMEHTVTPTIGQILGVQPFTCADCHPKPR